jgi:hypothetical protein
MSLSNPSNNSSPGKVSAHDATENNTWRRRPRRRCFVALLRGVAERGTLSGENRLETFYVLYNYVMYTRRAIFLVAGLLLTCTAALHARSAQTSDTATKEAPPAVYVDKGACPFECCTYREWTVQKPTTVFDQPNGHVVAHLSQSERVTALTGEVISKPIAAKANDDIPDTPIKKGDTFYILDYYGEGGWGVWFHGKKLTIDEIYLTENPRPRFQFHWWAKIRDSRGKIGWVLAGNNNFANQDACG